MTSVETLLFLQEAAARLRRIAAESKIGAPELVTIANEVEEQVAQLERILARTGQKLPLKDESQSSA